MPTLDKNDLLSAPAYAKLVDDILAGIADGTLKEGHRLASESMLKEQYNISIKSIKRGLGLLVDKGILTRKRGSGTYIANVNALQPQMLVRRDTIAIVSCWEYCRYHPFFTERNKGILARLAELGWNVFDWKSYDKKPSKSNDFIAYQHVTPADLEMDLSKHPEVAGVISLNLSDTTVKSIIKNGRYVVHSEFHKEAPCVYYDWYKEMTRLFDMTLEKGARRICVVSSQPKEVLMEMCRKSIMAAGLNENDIKLTYLLCESSKKGTELTNQAFNLAQDAFKQASKFDGLIVTDDYEATGVIDALLSIDKLKWSEIIIAALLNKESKLPARIPMTALVADGYACGLAIADLLNEQITTAGKCQSSICLSCSHVEWK